MDEKRVRGERGSNSNRGKERERERKTISKAQSDKTEGTEVLEI